MQYSLGFCTTQITSGAIVTAGSHIGMKVCRSSRSLTYRQRLLTTSQVGEVTTLSYDDQIQPPVYNFSVRNNSLTIHPHYLCLVFRPRRHWPMRRTTSVVSTTLDILRISVSVCRNVEHSPSPIDLSSSGFVTNPGTNSEEMNPAIMYKDVG